MNTRISYEYRDASNYHFHGSIVASGEMTDALWERIRRACESNELFIAHQVGLPEVFPWVPGPHADDENPGHEYDEEDDHCWHRLDETEPWELTSDEPDDARDVERLITSFETARKEGWKAFDPRKRPR